jgi:hypothetical protein
VFTFAFATPPGSTERPDHAAYLPTMLDASKAVPLLATARSCYANRACCEQEIACQDRAYLPLLLRQ